MTVTFESCSRNREESLSQSNINTVRKVSPQEGAAIYATLHVEGCPVRFQLDTGASCNIIRVHDLKGVGRVRLNPTEKSLCMYDGSVTKQKGVCMLHVENLRTNTRQKMEFVVVDQAPVALLAMGLKAGQQFGLVTVHNENIPVHGLASAVTHSSGAHLTKESLFESFQSVFDGGFHVTARVHVPS